MTTELATHETPGGGQGVPPSAADAAPPRQAASGGRLADWRENGPRPISTLVTHAPPGRDVVHFASDVPPRAEKPSVLSPDYDTQRAPLGFPPPPAQLVAPDLSPAVLEAMRERETRSVLDPSAGRLHVAPFDASVPVLVSNPTPVRIMASGAVPLPSRMPASSRRSVLEAPPRGPTPCLYPRERP